MDNKSIKHNIYKRRIEKGYSQAELARRINVSSTSYQKIEKGDTALLSERLFQLAEALDLSEAELVFGYIPDQESMENRLEDIKQEYFEKESALRDKFDSIIKEKDKRIEELENSLKDKNTIIELQHEKILKLQK